MTKEASEVTMEIAEWARRHEQGAPPMGLQDRVKELRKEHGWSQGELAERVAADPAQISRYENGHIAPSADAIVRLAEIFDVSCDYLLVDEAPRRRFRSPEDALGDALGVVSELSNEDQTMVKSFIDALVTKTRLKILAGGS